MSQATSIDHGNESNHPAAVPTTARHRASRFAATVLGAGALLAAASPAGAAIEFQDDFDTGVPSGSALNTAPTGWSVIAGSGTVDWIADNTYGLRCNGNAGGCVDLDGSSNDAGIMSHGTFTLTAGTQYLLTAYLSGNQRGTAYPSLAGPDDVNFGFRDSSGSITGGWTTVTGVLATQPYTLISFAFTPAATLTGVSVFFEAVSNNNVGPLLDDVTLTAVPLPAAAWLLLSGLVGFVALGRRRQPTPA